MAQQLPPVCALSVCSAADSSPTLPPSLCREADPRSVHPPQQELQMSSRMGGGCILRQGIPSSGLPRRRGRKRREGVEMLWTPCASSQDAGKGVGMGDWAPASVLNAEEEEEEAGRACCWRGRPPRGDSASAPWERLHTLRSGGDATPVRIWREAGPRQKKRKEVSQVLCPPEADWGTGAALPLVRGEGLRESSQSGAGQMARASICARLLCFMLRCMRRFMRSVKKRSDQDFIGRAHRLLQSEMCFGTGEEPVLTGRGQQGGSQLLLFPLLFSASSMDWRPRQRSKAPRSFPRLRQGPRGCASAVGAHLAFSNRPRKRAQRDSFRSCTYKKCMPMGARELDVLFRASCS